MLQARWSMAIISALLIQLSGVAAGPVEIDSLVTTAMNKWQAPGVAVVVVYGDQIVALKGYGRKRFDAIDPITPDTLFPLASCTKAFTSTLMAMLVDDGLAKWDDPVRRHLPTFALSDPHADALVTLRDLLAHRTGVTGHDLLWYHSTSKIDDVLSRIDKLPLSYPFRGGFDYSSIMYMAIGRAEERICGKPWEKLIHERITSPLQMKGVYFTTTEIPRNADRATGHRLSKSRIIETMPVYEMSEPNPSGSIHASARDVSHWLQFHLRQGGVEGKQLVSQRSLAETQFPQNIIRLEGNARAMNPDTIQLSYGMGWVVSDHRGKKVLAHGGMIDGFRVQFTLLPEEKLGIALFNNLHETRMNQALTNSLIDLYCDLPKRDWNAFFQKIVTDTEQTRAIGLTQRNRQRDPSKKPTLPAILITGSYRNPAYGNLKVLAREGKLSIEWSSFSPPLEHFSGDIYRVTEGYFEDQLIAFEKMETGKIHVRFIGNEFVP